MRPNQLPPLRRPRTSAGRRRAAAAVQHLGPAETLGHSRAPRAAPQSIDEQAFSQGARQPVGAQIRARAGRGSWARSREPASRAALRRMTSRRYVKRLLTAAAHRGAGYGAAESAGGGFRAFRRGRSQTAVAHPENFRRAAAGQLAQSAACDAARGCGYHRPGGGARGA